MKILLTVTYILGMSILLISCSNKETLMENGNDNHAEISSNWGFDLIYNKTTLNPNLFHRVKVAIIDSGIYKDHPILKGKIKKEFNAINPKKKIEDEFGHGTAIAGIISRIGKYQHISQTNVDIYDVKVLDEKGSGEIEDIVSGIGWAIKEKVDVINISFGIQNNSPILEKAINEALSNGIIIVAASGNALVVEYPAKYEGVLSITAINKNMERSGLIAKGKIDYAAPGYEIRTTDHIGDFSVFSGTSFSTAFVTGFIAFLISTTEEKITSKNIHEHLDLYTEDLGEKGYDDSYGFGFLKYR